MLVIAFWVFIATLSGILFVYAAAIGAISGVILFGICGAYAVNEARSYGKVQ